MIPYGRHSVDEEDIAAVVDVLRSEALTSGHTSAAFEAALAEAVGAGFAVSCANGTAALHLAALALDLGPGDAAVVPSITFVATANAVRFVGAEVVFADVDPETGLMTAASLQEALGRVPAGLQAKVVFPVHMNGQCVDLAGLEPVARAHGLAVVADSSHAIGSTYRDSAGRPAPAGSGRHCDLATFSFHPVKTIAMGEGGAVTTDREDLAGRIRRLRSHGIVREPAHFALSAEAWNAHGEVNPWYYEMPEVGFNYRASDIHCALGLSQLRKLPDFVARRQALARRYDAALGPLSPLVRPPARIAHGEPAWHLYPARFDFPRIGRTRAAVMRELAARGVGTQVHYIPIHRQPYYRARYGEVRLPGADAYYDKVLSLPLFPAMADTDLDTVVAAMTEVVGAG